MEMNLVLRVLAKHLINAAEEIEQGQKIVDNQDRIDNIPVPPVIKENNDGKESSKKTSEENSKKASSKRSSGKKASEESEVVEPKKDLERPLDLSNVPPVVEATPVVEALPAKRSLTLEIVRGECRKVLDTHGRKALEDILVKYKALKTSDLKPENFEAVMMDCAQVLGASHEF